MSDEWIDIPLSTHTGPGTALIRVRADSPEAVAWLARQPKPRGRFSLDCTHRGAATGEMAWCDSCAGGKQQDVPLYACAVHGRCTTEKRGFATRDSSSPAEAWCRVCKDKQAKPIMQVRSNSAGIGDHLLSLAIAEGLRRQFPTTEIVYAGAGWVHSWLHLFDAGDHIVHEPLKAPTVFCEHDVGTPSFNGFRREGLARWEWWQREFGVSAALPSVNPLPQWARDRAVPVAARVIISPFAAYADRTWPLERWLEVEQQLLAIGFRCIIIHSGGDAKLDRFQSEKWLGRSAAEVAALMQSAVCLAGNDSGMAHLAGMLRVPAVAICSGTSDQNIMGLYPTTRSLGGRAIGFDRVQPADVVAAIRETIRAGLTDFPVQRFGEIILERDNWRLPCWEHVYAQLWRTVRSINPRRIVEIGTRAGYSAWTMLDACPEATLIGIDADFDGPLAVTHGGFKGACDHARSINPARFELRIADSQKLDALPVCDLVFVDGDHSYGGAMNDLRLAERSGATAILLDDTQFDDVRRAAAEFAGGGRWTVRYIPSDTGLALFERTT